jgi:hypothetical protein
MTLDTFHCTMCDHEWQDTEFRPCDWCGAPAAKLETWKNVLGSGTITVFVRDSRDNASDAELNQRYQEACERGKLDV